MLQRMNATTQGSGVRSAQIPCPHADVFVPTKISGTEPEREGKKQPLWLPRSRLVDSWNNGGHCIVERRLHAILGDTFLGDNYRGDGWRWATLIVSASASANFWRWVYR